jgi:hypothetical protein
MRSVLSTTSAVKGSRLALCTIPCFGLTTAADSEDSQQGVQAAEPCSRGARAQQPGCTTRNQTHTSKTSKEGMKQNVAQCNASPGCAQAAPRAWTALYDLLPALSSVAYAGPAVKPGHLLEPL